MSTTDAARESARRPDGQFGPQARTELDPANAGLDVPEAPPPTWEEALAHAEVLRAQGVDVSINEMYRVIRIRDEDGKLHDASDGTPSVQEFYPHGTAQSIEHWTNGKLNDTDDGRPACQRFHPDGKLGETSYYRDNLPNDPDADTPAFLATRPDGSVSTIIHYRNGELYSPDGGPPHQNLEPDGTPTEYRR